MSPRLDRRPPRETATRRCGRQQAPWWRPSHRSLTALGVSRCAQATRPRPSSGPPRASPLSANRQRRWTHARLVIVIRDGTATNSDPRSRWQPSLRCSRLQVPRGIDIPVEGVYFEAEVTKIMGRARLLVMFFTGMSIYPQTGGPGVQTPKWAKLDEPQVPSHLILDFIIFLSWARRAGLTPWGEHRVYVSHECSHQRV